MQRENIFWISVRAIGLTVVLASEESMVFAGGNMDPINRYAWAENVGWVNTGPVNSGGVTIANIGVNICLSGYAWAENIGWISLGAPSATLPYANTTAANYGVNIDLGGKLSGYAWSENAGWINFGDNSGQVTIDFNTGCFSGYAWGENTGWINLSNAVPVEYYVSTSWTVDTTPPAVVSIVFSRSQFISNQGGMATVTVSEALSGFDVNNITVTGGTKGTLTSLDATHYELGVTSGSSDGALTVTIPAGAFTDLAGNLLAAKAEASATVDATPPAVVSIVFSRSQFISNQGGVATVTVSEALSGFDANNITVTGGTKGTLTSLDATHYELGVTSGSSDGALTVTIPAGAFTDLAGNLLAAQAEASATVDATPPAVVSIVFSRSQFISNQGGMATVTVSEALSGFDVNNITVTGGTKGTLTSLDATHYELGVTSGSSDGELTVTIPAGAFTDLAGNLLAAQAEASAMVDTTPPAVVSIVFSRSQFISNQGGMATVTVSEALSGFDVNNITITGGTKGTLTSLDATHYELGVTSGSSGGALTVTIPAGAFTDLAGNLLAAQVQAMVVVIHVGFMDSTDKSAWSENAGWINFTPLDGGVTVIVPPGTSGYLGGFAWAENIGWISLGVPNATLPYANTTAADYGVNMDSAGRLSGYAWSENAGWIKFGDNNGQAIIDFNTGCLDGYVWSENIGWIHFKGITAPPMYQVRTRIFGMAGSVFLVR